MCVGCCLHSRKHDDTSSKLHKPVPVAEKRVAAVQYYLSKARYSPLSSGNKRGREGEGALRQPSKVGFGSGAPRWPAENPRYNPSLLRQDSKSRESGKLGPQPLLSGSKPHQALHSGSKPHQPLHSGSKPHQALVSGSKPHLALVSGSKPHHALHSGSKPYQPLISGSKPYQPLISGSKPYQPLITDSNSHQPLHGDSKPHFGGYLPSLAAKKSGTLASGKKDILPSVGDFGPPREAPWKPALPQRPPVVSGASYHSSVASSKRHNVHGRTNWAAK